MVKSHPSILPWTLGKPTCENDPPLSTLDPRQTNLRKRPLPQGLAPLKLVLALDVAIQARPVERFQPILSMRLGFRVQDLGV